MADPVWLYRNLIGSWKRRARFADFVRRLRYIYTQGASIQDKRWKDWIIGFRYPQPVGEVRLLLRSNGGSDNFIHSEIFEHESYNLHLSIAPRTILDLGANIGLTTIYFSRRYPQAALACVEPIPENLRVLRRNLDLNNVSATVVPAAIDKLDGTVRMGLHHFDYGHKVVANDGAEELEIVEVAAISMPTLLDQLGWDRVGLLKVDIEGHEETLFSGDSDWLLRVDAICMECHEISFVQQLPQIAKRFGFNPPVAPFGLWLLVRP